MRPSRSAAGFRKKLLGRGEDGFFVGAHLDLRDGFDRDRNTLLGVKVLLRRDVETHELERELTIGFDAPGMMTAPPPLMTRALPRPP